MEELQGPQVYRGSPKLLIAIDVGTTFSGVSYSILEPGCIPEIYGVTRFPGRNDSKIPSLLLYDEKGECRAVGAEAEHREMLAGDIPLQYHKAAWFKLHMRPNPERTPHVTQNLPKIPPNKDIIQLFSDMFRHLYECTIAHINETHILGQNEREAITQDIEFVICHPNGWEGAQQARLREAAIQGGLITEESAHAKIHFVTEGEADLHFCLRHGPSKKIKDEMRDGKGILIVDAGGGTVDLSAYGSRTGKGGSTMIHEISSPDCIFQGSVFVTERASEFIQRKFGDTRYHTSVKRMVNYFDQFIKTNFDRISETQRIPFGSATDTDLSLNIQSGHLAIDGRQVATFFLPAETEIMQAIFNQVQNTRKPISTILLVGGFSASSWLFNQLQKACKHHNLHLFRPDARGIGLNKAVADGAALFYIDHMVKARQARLTYGLEYYSPYNVSSIEHIRRFSAAFNDADGETYIDQQFCPILKKGTEVMEESEFRQEFYRRADTQENFENPMLDAILSYQGDNEAPHWIDEEQKNYTKLCTVVSDISKIKKDLRATRKNGKTYYELRYDVVLFFGLTELKAYTAWKYHGREIRSPAKIIFHGP